MAGRGAGKEVPGSRGGTPGRARGGASSQSGSSRAGEASSPSSAAPPLELPHNLLELVDLLVRVTLTGPTASTIQGRIYTYDSTTGFLVLECPPSAAANSKLAPSTRLRDYRLIKLAQIKDVVLVEDDSNAMPAVGSSVQLRPLSTDAIANNERQAVRAEDERLSRQGPPGTSKLAQGLFDGMAKTLPCRWESTTIVVLDDIHVAPPYDRAAPGPGAKPERQKLDRVGKVLEGTRQAYYRQRDAQTAK